MHSSDNNNLRVKRSLAQIAEGFVLECDFTASFNVTYKQSYTRQTSLAAVDHIAMCQTQYT